MGARQWLVEINPLVLTAVHGNFEARMYSSFEIDPYEPCPCGSGKKYKFCCAAKAKDNRHGKFPIGTIAWYGPDDTTTTKVAAGVLLRDSLQPIVKRWLGSNVKTDPRVAEEIKQFFALHGVKNVVTNDGNVGCPHEEGIDFPDGQECPMCPFWAGKQGIILRNVDGDEPEDAFDDDEDWEAADELEDDDADDGSGTSGRSNDDFDELMARIQAIAGDIDDQEQAIRRICKHLQEHLTLPCLVTGIEDFQWEEPYVIGGWSPAEYRRLRKTQPSYRDRYELLSIDAREKSEWMMIDEDIAARVRRVKDGKEFMLGLSELEALDKSSNNYRLLDDYAVWFVNSR